MYILNCNDKKTCKLLKEERDCFETNEVMVWQMTMNPRRVAAALQWSPTPALHSARLPGAISLSVTFGSAVTLRTALGALVALKAIPEKLIFSKISCRREKQREKEWRGGGSA